MVDMPQPRASASQASNSAAGLAGASPTSLPLTPQARTSAVNRRASSATALASLVLLDAGHRGGIGRAQGGDGLDQQPGELP